VLKKYERQPSELRLAINNRDANILSGQNQLCLRGAQFTDMKGGKLKRSLKKFLQTDSKKSKSTAVEATKAAKKDTRVVWHQWSDEKRTRLPYRSEWGTVIVVVGDGDLSFSASLLDTIPGEQIVATILDTEEAMKEKYPGASTNVDQLRNNGARVLFSLDATKLSRKYLIGRLGEMPKVSRIVFNFPHTGEGIKDRDYNIRAQQKLIVGFFQASTKLLLEQGVWEGVILERKTLMATPLAQEVVSQPDEEGDTHIARQKPEIHLTCWTGDPYDDWNVKKLATSVPSLHLHESFSFDLSRYAGYKHRRTIGAVTDDEAFTKKSARTFVFTVGKE
jgi:25S rRNA (uracil2634-N3)-methyltransferase